MTQRFALTKASLQPLFWPKGPYLLLMRANVKMQLAGLRRLKAAS